MFLHSGASLHGHEYSNRAAAINAPSQQARRSPLLRSALAPPQAGGHLAYLHAATVSITPSARPIHLGDHPRARRSRSFASKSPSPSLRRIARRSPRTKCPIPSSANPRSSRPCLSRSAGGGDGFPRRARATLSDIRHQRSSPTPKSSRKSCPDCCFSSRYVRMGGANLSWRSSRQPGLLGRC